MPVFRVANDDLIQGSSSSAVDHEQQNEACDQLDWLDEATTPRTNTTTAAKVHAP
jgi:hypothetical protein